MKKYENPMLKTVSINRNDIITGSNDPQVSLGGSYNGGLISAPGQRGLDDWYEGY